MTKKILFATAGIAALIIIIFSIRSLTKTTHISEPENAIQNTNGVLHTIPLGEIVSGGPEEGTFPSINDPIFVSSDAATTIDDNQLGLSYEHNGSSRFYPYSLLMRYQTVNDVIDNQSILVTFSPLTYSGIIFDRTVNDSTLTFTTSSNLWNSNLLVRDTATGTIWSQLLGEAIVGPSAGTQLTILPSEQITYEQWKRIYPDGEVLTINESDKENPVVNPYEEYYNNDVLFFPVTHEDNRMPSKTIVLGIRVGSTTKAYPLAMVQGQKEMTETIENQTVTITYDKTTGIVAAYTENGDEKMRIPATQIFWFAWAAIFPDTQLAIAPN